VTSQNQQDLLDLIRKPLSGALSRHGPHSFVELADKDKGDVAVSATDPRSSVRIMIAYFRRDGDLTCLVGDRESKERLPPGAGWIPLTTLLPEPALTFEQAVAEAQKHMDQFGSELMPLQYGLDGLISEIDSKYEQIVSAMRAKSP